VPPMDLTPDFNLLNPAHAAVQQASSAFHSAWLSDLASLHSLAPGSLTGLDAYALLGSVSANPSAYGLTNVTNPALLDAQLNPTLNPDTYLFWDGEHPTSSGHQLLANAAFTALVPEPASLLLLVAGLVLQGCRRKRLVG
jgi:phospholipase/lecithinase/hemolysin